MKPKDYNIMRDHDRTPETINGIHIDDFLRGVEESGAEQRKREIALGGPVRSLAERGRFDPLKRHWYRESDLWARHCGRGNNTTTCGQTAGNRVHYQSDEQDTVSRAFLERDDLG